MMAFLHPQELLMPSPFCALLDATHTLHAPSNLELHQDESSYQVRLAAPGVRIQDVKVEVANGVMRIHAAANGAHRHFRFERSIRLPKDADCDRAEATYADGMLSVSVPKLASVEPCQLTIQPVDDVPMMDDGDDDRYHLDLAAPGVRREDLKITLKSNVLHVAGETKGERRHAAIDRKLRIPEHVDTSTIAVTHADGLLTFTMAPKAEAPPRQLIIQAAPAEPCPPKDGTPGGATLKDAAASPEETPPAA